jgi:excisionase family DNA binding protein
VNDDELLRPREVAEIFGVRPTTIARWAREGKLTPMRTPGGHRRYKRSGIRALLTEDAEPNMRIRDGRRSPDLPADPGAP